MRDLDLDQPVKDVHPYLRLWLYCRRYGQKVISPDGHLLITPALPFAGSALDQDAEVMMAFEICDDIMDQLQRENQAKNQALDSTRQQLLQS